MQTVMNIDSVFPFGSKVLVKRRPIDEKVRSILIPEDLRDRNTVKGDLYCGTVISVGPRTKSAKFGSDRGWFDPGHVVWFWNKYDWKDNEIVLKDEKSGDEYLMIEEEDVKAYEVQEAQC